MKLKKAKKFTKTAKKRKVLSTKPKKDLSTVTVDEFLTQDYSDDSETELITTKRNVTPQNDDSDTENDNINSDDDMDAESHKKGLKNLAKTDPEFYKFLKQNDKKLLEFNLSDQEDAVSEAGDDDKHIPEDNLQVASDESDYEAEDGEEILTNEVKIGPTKVTLKLLKSWQEELQQDKSAKTIKCVVDAFHAALLTVSDPDGPKSKEYKVEGAAVFNGVVQLCVLNLPAAFRKFLKISGESRFEAHKLKRFPKIKGTIKSYLADLLKILMNVTSADILTVLLKHLHQMIPYTQSFSALDKPLLRILLKIWSTGEETVRVVAFLSILKIATSRKESILETLFKTMYIKYVENAKFVSPSTLPGINFMRHSLAEIYMLDPGLAYNHAFLYIRQLAIHLRNAMTLKKKEHFQAVYNWQYINSLRFWSELITLSSNGSMLRSLLYPLVQIITGTVKLIPTSQFYPLRFHCVQMLIDISKGTGVFIPVLPFLLEILNSYDFNKRHKAVTMKPISFIPLLRMSKAQLAENGFKDGVIENIYKLILENAAKESHTIYFPDLYIPCVIQLKEFLKKCKVANFGRKIKQLLEKIQENRQFVEEERNKIIVDLSDMGTIKNWENRLKNQGTPLAKFYESWWKLHQSQKMKLLTQNDELADCKLPKLNKSKGKKRTTDNGHDSDLDMPVEAMNELLKKQAERKMNKKKKQKVTDVRGNEELPMDDNDTVRKMSLDDWD